MIGDIAARLPRIFPKSTITVDEAFEFEGVDIDYTLQKSPFKRVQSVTAVVGGVRTDLTQGTDFVLVDTDNDGEVDSIRFQSTRSLPDVGTDVAVTYEATPIIRRYFDAIGAESRTTDDKIERAIDSHQVSAATNSDLDRIGALFGPLGRRRGRSQQDYELFLRSIVQSFSGRGTKPGLKFAVSAAIGTDPDKIEIVEDFDQVGYTIRIQIAEVESISSVVNDLARLADPSGVALLAPPVVVLVGDQIEVNSTGITVASTTGIGGGTLSDGKI